jgi:hypothetical protein
VTPEQIEERRAFKASMRVRIALFAAQRQIPKGEIAWIGRLKHYDPMCFAKRYLLRNERASTGNALFLVLCVAGYVWTLR